MRQNHPVLEVELPIVLEDGITVPTYATTDSVGMDVRCKSNVVLAPGERKLVPTGLRIAVPKGFEAQIRPRSGLALRHGISMVNTPGTIDPDYRGEVQVLLINLGTDVVQLQQGERIAQMIICPVARANVRIVNELESTERGVGGFGSTGTH